jgi:hypothetical protein
VADTATVAVTDRLAVVVAACAAAQNSNVVKIRSIHLLLDRTPEKAHPRIARRGPL